MKLVEKKRKASAVDFAPGRFKIKTKKTTRSSGVSVSSDQNTPQDETPEKRVVEPVPEQVVAPASA